MYSNALGTLPFMGSALSFILWTMVAYFQASGTFIVDMIMLVFSKLGSFLFVPLLFVFCLPYRFGHMKRATNMVLFKGFLV